MDYELGIKLDRIEQKLDYLIELITTPSPLPEETQKTTSLTKKEIEE